MFKKSMCFILALLMMAVSCCALAEESTLTVRGAGVVYVDADRVTISVGVREVAAQVTDAQSAVNEKISAVISAMNDLGVTGDSISTNSIGIYPNYDYSSNEEQINGYTAYNSILVVISDVSNAGTYIDAAFAAGANSLDYVDFSAADTEDAGSRALAMAVQNALEKAQVLAEAAGMRLGGILEIREADSDSYNLPVMYAKGETAPMDTEVVASKQQVNAAVNVVFELVGGD